MTAGDINPVQSILKGLIHRAIVNSVNFVSKKCKLLGNSPQEPDFVASLTLNFTSELFHILKAVFVNKKFSVTGIFCHQKPIVDIKLSKNPELGDLLLVYIYKDVYGDTRYNSLLLQAKRSTSFSTRISTSDEHQLKLYTDWPNFTYKRAGRLTGTTRNITPKTINDGAQYLLIDDDPIYGLSGLSGTFPMGCATPNKTLTINNDLTDELIDFLKFKSGRAFEGKTSKTDEWTLMIWELLDITKLKASKRKNIGIKDFPRQKTEATDGYCFFMSDLDSEVKELHEELGAYNFLSGSDFNYEDDDGSLSVILIECNDQETSII